jgi:8-oxo-dGTP pyrophosphatase MutT (NUDIX family)
MLDLDPNRQGPAPRDASTLVVARDAPGGGIEVFCVERHKGGFLGGAVVFPGGKLEPGDLDAEWERWSTPPRPILREDGAAVRGLAIAACREALEEAAILPIVGTPPSHAQLLEWRAQIARGGSLRELLIGQGAQLDLASLHPFARWVTPVAESRRYDTLFFLWVPAGDVTGAHDDHETTASFWATPAEVLARHLARELFLAPPTHRTLEVLAAAKDTAGALAIADRACLEPICPRAIVQREAAGEAMAIVLPGDPEHEVREKRVPGPTRYVWRDGRFLPEDPPA